MKREALAYERGYRVVQGVLYNPFGVPLKGYNKKGYMKFSLVVGSRTDKTRKNYGVFFHRLVAYQKYGDRIYEEGIVVRHKDGNSLNNLNDNILIGSPSDNMMDKKPEDRLYWSINASTSLRVLTDEEVELVRHRRKQGISYAQLAVEFSLSGKGHAHYIVNNTYKTIR